MNKKLTNENLVAFDFDAIIQKTNELSNMQYRKNAIRKIAQQKINLRVLAEFETVCALGSIIDATYKKRLYSMNAYIYENKGFIVLRSWNTVVAWIDKTNNICIDITDYIFRNVSVQGFNTGDKYYYSIYWGAIHRADTTNSSKRQVSRFARLYNAKIIAYKELN